MDREKIEQIRKELSIPLTYAIKLLKENQSIKEVAFATGFSDTNHLIKTFKTFEGITPKNYQRNLFSEYKIVS